MIVGPDYVDDVLLILVNVWKGIIGGSRAVSKLSFQTVLRTLYVMIIFAAFS